MATANAKEIVSKAVKDDAFRARLLKDPRAAIEKEFGGKLPDGVTVRVHENSASEIHLVLPAHLDMSSRALSDNELEHVAGGVTSAPTLLFVTSKCKSGPICGGLPK